MGIFEFERKISRKLYLWNGERGQPPTMLVGHDDGIIGAQLLPDGRILSWSDDKTLRLWDGESGLPLAVLKGHEAGISGVQVLPDGRILSWSDDKTLRIWNGESGKLLATLRGHNVKICGVQLLPDGRILSWSEDAIYIWAPTGSLEYGFAQIAQALTVAGFESSGLNLHDRLSVMFSKWRFDGRPACWSDDRPSPKGQFTTQGGRLVAMTEDKKLVWLQLYKGAQPIMETEQSPR